MSHLDQESFIGHLEIDPHNAVLGVKPHKCTTLDVLK